jgi:hypothetical protein
LFWELKGGGLSFSPENWSAVERAAKMGFNTQANMFIGTSLSILLNPSQQHYTPSNAFASFSLDSKTLKENGAKTPDENLNTLSHLHNNTVSSHHKAGFNRKVFDTIPESTPRHQNFETNLITPPSGSYLKFSTDFLPLFSDGASQNISGSRWTFNHELELFSAL